MSKGLETFKYLKERYEIERANQTEINIIEKELKEHEQYKATEQELGIDLVTLFKALKNGIWVKYDADFGFTGKPHIVIKKDKATEICFRDKKWWIQENDFSLKDYGKTWALTREVLEK